MEEGLGLFLFPRYHNCPNVWTPSVPAGLTPVVVYLLVRVQVTLISLIRAVLNQENPRLLLPSTCTAGPLLSYGPRGQRVTPEPKSRGLQLVKNIWMGMRRRGKEKQTLIPKSASPSRLHFPAATLIYKYI